MFKRNVEEIEQLLRKIIYLSEMIMSNESSFFDDQGNIQKSMIELMDLRDLVVEHFNKYPDEKKSPQLHSIIQKYKQTEENLFREMELAYQQSKEKLLQISRAKTASKAYKGMQGEYTLFFEDQG